MNYWLLYFQRNSGCDQHVNHCKIGNQRCKLVIPDYAKRKEICSKLDITIYSGNNWRDVADRLGFNTQEIKSIDDKAQRCPNFSPMESVLTTWEQRDSGCSLDRLVNILQDIQRLDVVSDLGFPVDLESSEMRSWNVYRCLTITSSFPQLIGLFQITPHWS